MGSSPFPGLLVFALDVVVQLSAVDPPNPSAADLYGGQLAGAHEGISLGHAHAEVCGDVLEGQKAGLDAAVWRPWFLITARWRHGFTLATLDVLYGCLTGFPFVCYRVGPVGGVA
jgi:hypothetical protein